MFCNDAKDGVRVIDGILVIPEGTVTIEDYAYSDRDDFTGISFPDSLESIGDYAFNNCRALERVELSKNIRDVGYGAFVNCCTLWELRILGDKTDIWEYAFYDSPLSKLTAYGDEVRFFENPYRCGVTDNAFAYDKESSLEYISMTKAAWDLNFRSHDDWPYERIGEDGAQGMGALSGTDMLMMRYEMDAGYKARDIDNEQLGIANEMGLRVSASFAEEPARWLHVTVENLGQKRRIKKYEIEALFCTSADYVKDSDDARYVPAEIVMEGPGSYNVRAGFELDEGESKTHKFSILHHADYVTCKYDLGRPAAKHAYYCIRIRAVFSDEEFGLRLSAWSPHYMFEVDVNALSYKDERAFYDD